MTKKRTNGDNTFRIGTVVRLKRGQPYLIPEGRPNNASARIEALCPEFGKGAIRTDRALRGMRYWNTDALEVVKRRVKR